MFTKVFDKSWKVTKSQAMYVWHVDKQCQEITDHDISGHYLTGQDMPGQCIVAHNMT
jgi:hypothetical protein